MTIQKTKSPPQGYSVNRLSELTGADRRTINKIITANGIESVGVSGNAKLYPLKPIEDALSSKPDKSLKDEKLTEEIRKLRIENNRKEKLLVEKSAVVKVVQEWESEIAPVIEQKLEREYPAAVACMEVAQARIYGAKLNDNIRECNHKLIEKIQALGA